MDLSQPVLGVNLFDSLFFSLFRKPIPLSLLRRSYPFCWRSDTPLIYKAVPSWFVAVESIRDKLLKNNAETYWVPPFVNEKRFQNW